MAATVLGLSLTVLASLFLATELGAELLERLAADAHLGVVTHAAFVAIVYFLIYGNLVYQLARLGHFWRLSRHQPAAREELEAVYGPSSKPAALAILVPSYKEELVIRQTLLSAALMEWPRRRVVLLIDDAPNPISADDKQALLTARSVPGEIQAALAQPARHFQRELAAFERRERHGELDRRGEAGRLSTLYGEAAAWLETQAAAEPVKNHSDRLFVERVLREPARQHRARAAELQESDPTLTTGRIHREYRRLARLFDVEVTSFERKQFVNLSHEPNKAMNLNAYIALLGRSFRRRKQVKATLLEEVHRDQASLVVPDADYLITVDADSLLLNDYALRLVHVMEQPGHERFAVIQTPYTAVPGAEKLIERIAGATTDIQHIVHQGFTHWSATYWVGANALLRRNALEDIKTVELERGFAVAKYIEDRTVIEDTESSIDLIRRGWKLYNYPDRLAYSATPPDFGSLLIQRRRWANGGLMILPKLIAYVFERPFQVGKLSECFFRAHYLASIAGTSGGILLLLVCPFEDSIETPWLPLVALLPYCVLYGRDLVQSGYGLADLPRVYALNLALIPINLGGVARSLHQWLTGKKSAFLRTPKVPGRTASPAGYLLAEWALLACCVVGIAANLMHERWLQAHFAMLNGVLLTYALFVLVGARAMFEDIAARFKPGIARTMDETGLTAIRRRELPAGGTAVQHSLERKRIKAV